MRWSSGWRRRTWTTREESLGPSTDVGSGPFTPRRSGFRDPSSGWNAARAGAHIMINNDLLAGIADRLRAGEEAAYDNSPVVDDEQLQALRSQ